MTLDTVLDEREAHEQSSSPASAWEESIPSFYMIRVVIDVGMRLSF